ncbi:hypothetical protein EV702DRAFT_1281242 [Suillus placidus]|uniref:CHAT domain-containing protein n=1 Tax=Suillus placidus TaxID=48579 RepID=A0A9P7CYF8_9AGAM|nr:hypothetical protein EV702DRAFT_1281242 [Suillus placidus]
MEIRASYELGRMLGSGEVIGKLQTWWDELLSHGDEPFDLSFPPVRDVYPSLTLKAGVVHACDDQVGALFDFPVNCEIARDTDAGHARFAEYMTSNAVSHLNDAAEHFQLVLDQCPVGHPDHPTALTNIAVTPIIPYLYTLTATLTWRHITKSTAADIYEAARLSHELLPLCPEGTYLRSMGVDSVVGHVISEYNNLPIDASDEGIHLRRNVLELCPVRHQQRSRALDNLAQSVEARFDQHSSIDDLDMSIQLARVTVSLCPEGHTVRDSYLNNLALSLESRFNHQGKPNDIDEAISLHVVAPAAWGALVTRFQKRSDPDDITRAVSLYRKALTLRPPGHPHRDTTLSNLALALKTRYNTLHVDEDLNEAIDQYRESLRVMWHDHPERHRTLRNLSSALCSRFMQSWENEDVEEALNLCQDSMDALPLLHPDRHYSYYRIHEAYMCLYQVQHKHADLSCAIANIRLVSRHPTQGFPSPEKYSHEYALEAYVTFFELLDGHFATRSSTISRREAAAAFHYARSLPVDAASCAIRRDNLRHAVELVEQGRGQQWSLASRLKTPVEDLESANPKLAHNYLELSRHVSDAAQSSATITDRAAADRAATEYRRLTRQWETAMAGIRNLQAFSRFLLPPSYEGLQAAARQGPVIILIDSQYLCNAIIILTSGEPYHVSLPSVALAELNNLKDRFARAIRHASSMGPMVSRNDLIVLLRTVWDVIMLPIVNVLQHDLKLNSHSRIWLCPTSAFTSIPLHAAHPFRTNADRSKEPCLEDLYICSYTPTLSALGQPGTGKGKALLAVDSELELVNKLVPATANRTTVSGDATTRAGALEALEENTWVHLACHGKQDPTQPYNSHFVMRDQPLTLLDIMEKHIPHAFRICFRNLVNFVEDLRLSLACLLWLIEKLWQPVRWVRWRLPWQTQYCLAL